MSRSYKKHNWFKCAGDTSMKKLFNRRIRRNKKYIDIPDGNAYRKLNCSWDIADYRFDGSWETFKKHNLEYFENEEEALNHWKRYYRSK